jgi:hypothetical protein
LVGRDGYEVGTEGRELAHHQLVHDRQDGDAGSIAATEVVTKIAWYYLHERIWAVIPWGRRQYNRGA